MTLVPVRETHIYLDETGKAYVQPSGFKVRMIIEALQNGYSAEGYAAGHTGITLAEVYAALTYYHDHRPEMDAEIEKLRKLEEEMRRNTPECEATRRVREAMKRQ